jgi:hypothetical protein
METEFVCLGLKILGACSYDAANPRVYFTLGDLLSVIALLLAISQLTSPIIKFRIRAHNLSNKLLITLAITAVISVFLSTILPFIPGEALPLIGYPIFWELLSALILVGVGTYVILIITRTAKFTPKNAEQYLNATVSFIAKGDDERLNKLAEEIYHSISGVIEEARIYDRYQAIEAKRKNEIYEVSETTKIANTILDAWSDKLFCQAIVCRSPVSAIEIIAQLSKNPSSGRGIALCNEIINQSFENQNSILNREEKYSGLGFFKNFMLQCFSNWRFVDSNYRPLQSWEHYKNTLKEWKVKKYCECTNIALQSYLEAKDYWQFPSSLFVAVDTMANLAMYQVANIKNLSEYEIYNSENQKILSEISRGYQDVIASVLKVDDYPEYDYDENDYDHFKDPSIFGIVAKGIYEYFEKLAMAKGHDDFIRDYAIGIWMDIFGVRSSVLSRNQEEIGKRLLFHIRKKVNENLDHEQRWYPAITKLLLSLNGISDSDSKNDDGMSERFHKEFLKMIKDKFPLLYQTEEKFALNMLPESFIYDPHNNKLIHKRFRGKTTELILNKKKN